MIELERHIEILLLGNDCVIVPGLGGFVAHHVSARYDENDGMFLPPLRTLGFNPQLKMNDSLLAQSYAEAYDISHPEALRRIESDVEGMMKQLDSEGKYELNGIGTLCVNKEGNIEFVPCEAGILTPEYYGLSCFDLPGIGKKATADKEKAQPAKVNKVVYIDSSAGKKNRTLNIRVSALRDMAVAAVILAFSFIISSPTEHDSKGLPDEKVKSGILCDVLTQGDQKQEKKVAAVKAIHKKTNHVKAVEKTERQTPAETKAVVSRPEKEENKTCWAIVLCSHVQLDNAKAFCSQLEKEGIAGKVMAKSSSNAKVVYGEYATEADAYKALNDMQDNARFKQGWITKIETSRK